MEIRKNTYHPSFGARRVDVAENVLRLGLKTVKAVQQALPKIQELGTDKTVFTIARLHQIKSGSELKGLKILASELAELPPPKTFLGRLWRKFFTPEIKYKAIGDSFSTTHEVKEQIVSLAEQALKEMNEKLEAQKVMAEIQSSCGK